MFPLQVKMELKKYFCLDLKHGTIVIGILESIIYFIALILAAAYAEHPNEVLDSKTQSLTRKCTQFFNTDLPYTDILILFFSYQSDVHHHFLLFSSPLYSFDCSNFRSGNGDISCTLSFFIFNIFFKFQNRPLMLLPFLLVKPGVIAFISLALLTIMISYGSSFSFGAIMAVFIGLAIIIGMKVTFIAQINKLIAGIFLQLTVYIKF